MESVHTILQHAKIIIEWICENRTYSAMHIFQYKASGKKIVYFKKTSATSLRALFLVKKGSNG